MDTVVNAVRAYTQEVPPRLARPRLMLVPDCETSTDITQRLTFGSARLYVVDWGARPRIASCQQEWIFYADNLRDRDSDGFQTLRTYIRKNRADVDPKDPEARKRITLIPAKQFTKPVLLRLAHEGALVVGFNLPFDLSRLAIGWRPARGDFHGGFSLVMHERAEPEKKKQTKTDPFAPRIRIKNIDSKRSVMSLGDALGDTDEAFRARRRAQGSFLDARTLAFVLTNRSYSLEGACLAFGVEHPKQHAEEHGVITPEYIDYNRADVRATFELTMKLTDEYDRHPFSPHYGGPR
jgi:hypothetical protein